MCKGPRSGTPDGDRILLSTVSQYWRRGLCAQPSGCMVEAVSPVAWGGEVGGERKRVRSSEHDSIGGEEC